MTYSKFEKMEITIRDLYENIDSLPKSLYKQVNDYLKFLKFQSNNSEDYEVPQWQIDETNRRIKFAEENPDSLLDFDEFMKEFEKKILDEN